MLLTLRIHFLSWKPYSLSFLFIIDTTITPHFLLLLLSISYWGNAIQQLRLVHISPRIYVMITIETLFGSFKHCSFSSERFNIDKTGFQIMK